MGPSLKKIMVNLNDQIKYKSQELICTWTFIIKF